MIQPSAGTPPLAQFDPLAFPENSSGTKLALRLVEVEIISTPRKYRVLIYTTFFGTEILLWSRHAYDLLSDRFGTDAVRYSMVIVISISALGSLLLFRGSRFYVADVEAATRS